MAKSAAYYALCDHGMNISRISFGQESVWSQCFDLSRVYWRAEHLCSAYSSIKGEEG